MKILSFLYATLSGVTVMLAATSAAQTPGNSSAVRHDQAIWSGSYIGLQFGGHFTDTHVNYVEGATPSASVDLNRNGVFGGIQFGDGRLLRGLYVGGEADSAFGRFVSGHISATGNGAPTSMFEAHRRFVGTVRGKIGRPFGRFLLYGTGGLALGGLEQGLTLNSAVPTNNQQVKGSSGGVEPGYAVGGGVEYRSNRRLSYQVESLYYRLQDETLSVASSPGSGASGSGYNSILMNSGSLVRVAANYHF